MSDILKSNQSLKNLDLKKKLGAIRLIEETAKEIIKDSDLPRMFFQYIIFVLDASRSMDGLSNKKSSKAEEVHNAVNSVIQRLEQSKNVNSFDIGLWCFSDSNYPIFKIKTIKESLAQNYNPIKLIDQPGETNLNETLIDVEKEIDAYCKINYTKNHQVLVLLLTDGAIDDRFESLKTINKIKENKKVTVSAMHLSGFVDENSQYYSWDEKSGQIDYNRAWTIEEVKASHERVGERFREFASADTFFINTIDPNEIRKHMIKSISVTSSLDKSL